MTNYLFQMTMMKRLIREMKEINEYENIKQLELVFPYNDDLVPPQVKKLGNTPYLKIKIDSNDLIVAFKKDYPFKPPILLINNEFFHKCYRISSVVALNEFTRKYKMKCLCCETLMCGNKWSPAMHVTDILDEYKKFKAIKVYLNSYSALLQLNTCFNHMLPLEMVEKIRDYL